MREEHEVTIAVRWLWRREEKEGGILRLDLRVHLNCRVGELAELMTIVTAQHAIIINFLAKSANHRGSHVDLVLAARGRLHRDSLLAEIHAAGFSCEETPLAERQSIE
jgi:(p)ppGpp synthase/HD superfamily hydrolase